jgi:hypothetical protein
MNPKTRIGLAGIVGLGGATAIAVGTGGVALPLLLISATGFAMKKIASEPDYEPTYQRGLSVSDTNKNICSLSDIYKYLKTGFENTILSIRNLGYSLAKIFYIISPITKEDKLKFTKGLDDYMTSRFDVYYTPKKIVLKKKKHSDLVTILND